jgi:hypothetical protein
MWEGVYLLEHHQRNVLSTAYEEQILPFRLGKLIGLSGGRSLIPWFYSINVFPSLFYVYLGAVRNSQLGLLEDLKYEAERFVIYKKSVKKGLRLQDWVHATIFAEGIFRMAGESQNLEMIDFVENVREKGTVNMRKYDNQEDLLIGLAFVGNITLLEHFEFTEFDKSSLKKFAVAAATGGQLHVIEYLLRSKRLVFSSNGNNQDAFDLWISFLTRSQSLAFRNW